MNDILAEFKSESIQLLSEMTRLLESVEADVHKIEPLEKYGQRVDRIMGSAKTLALAQPSLKCLMRIGQYTELCKAIGYRASQVKNNDTLIQTTVALLFDATEMLKEIVQTVAETELTESCDSKALLSQTFLDRLLWLNQQFDNNLRSSIMVRGGRVEGKEIVQALNKMGVSST